MGRIKNYQMDKHHTRAMPVKEEVSFAQTSNNTKTRKANNKGETNCFRCGDPNHWDCECQKLSGKYRYNIIETKEKVVSVRTQASEMI